MAETLQLSRDTKVYIRDLDSTLTSAANIVYWEVPVLDGFAFSQATESVEITLTEAADNNNRSRRGKLAFNTALAPVEWSLTTYVRPFRSVGGRTNATGGFVDNGAGFHHAVEEPLWAYMVMGAGERYTPNTGGTRLAGNNWGYLANGVYSGQNNLTVDFSRSNKTALRTFEMYFAMSSTSNSSAPDTVYRLVDAVVNGVTIDFDIEGIAQLQWTGFAKQISHSNSAPFLTSTANSINEAVNSTNTFIRNRLTTANVSTTQAAFTGGMSNKNYSLVLTGGSITIDNGITYLTPEELAKVNIPLGHVTGTRSVSGTLTCYLDDDTAANSSGALFRDMTSSTGTAASRNDFALTFSIGGANAPNVAFEIPNAHLEIPTHSIEDVISMEVNFMALPTSLSNTDEMVVKYYGVTPA